MGKNLIAVIGVTNDHGIGFDGKMPWPRSKSDMQRFVALTEGRDVIMGRKTYESIGNPLKRRTNYVLTRDVNYQADGVIIITDKEDVPDNAVVIGGAEIYGLLESEIIEWHVSLFPGEHISDTIYVLPDKTPTGTKWRLQEQEVCIDHIYIRYST